MTSQERTDAYQIVTDAIVGALEGAKNWDRPWTDALVGTWAYTTREQVVPGGNFPRNVRGSFYGGINVWLLSALGMQAGYTTPVWGTYKAWAEKKGQVRKGEKGSPCIFWKFLRVRDENDPAKVKTIPLARIYTVFNIAQVDLDEKVRAKLAAPRGRKVVVRVPVDVAEVPDAPPAPEPVGIDALIGEVQAFLDRENVGLGHGGDRAFYAIGQDRIQMPLRSQFKNAQGYACTFAHEAAHATGHESRLNRGFGKRFGDDAYAAEEVVAELGAAFVLAAAGHPYEVQHSASYLASWIQTMKSDKKAIFSAASAAQKAADRILGEAEPAPEEEVAEPVAA